jgi:hypothetical protein
VPIFFFFLTQFNPDYHLCNHWASYINMLSFTPKRSVGCFVQPDYNDAKADRETAARLVKKRGQLHTSGLSANKRRFTVGEYPEKGAEGKEKGKETAV